MISGEDLAFVRLAMRRRLVSAARIREAVERKKWDQTEKKNIAQILVEMGALDPKAVTSLLQELGSDERVTVSSELAKHAGRPSDRNGNKPPSERGQVKPASAPVKPSVESDDAQRARPKHPSRIGRYQITKLLGAGAMGAVYAAHDPDLARDVAIKVLQGEGAPTARAVARFKREAKLTARLDHPNVVRIHGAGVEDGYHYIAMDLVEGRSLAELVAIGEVTPRRAIHLARKIALAVQHAHERGVLHRDLKPANVLVDVQGEPRVTDFGLAVLAEPDESDRLTRTGAAVGTPAYMSPEQARGELAEIDPRTDVYSMGSTLYEMLTGGPPFEAPTFLELARKICDADPVPPRKRNQDVPVDLETICLKALEKEKAARFQTAEDMAKDLERLLHDEPVVAKRPSPARRAKRWAARRRGFVSLCLAAVILAAGVAGRWYRQPGEVEIVTHPAGAQVYLDKDLIGTAPVRRVVRAGRYTLEFKLDGYDSVPVGDRSVEVGRGNTTSREVDLVPLKGTLKLASSPPGAKVKLARLVGGSEVPVPEELTTPLEKLLPEGEYVARLTLAGYVVPPPVRGIRVGKGGAECLVPTVSLQPDDATLELEVDPLGSVVRAEREGTVFETSTVDESVAVKLGTGTYQVQATKPGYMPWLFTGPIGGTQRRRAALAPARSWARGLLGKLRLVAPPVVADVDGDGAPDLLVLEEDDEGRWLTLLGGGGETGFRWRERTDATAILPVLGDVDQDGVLDIALEVPAAPGLPAGFETRDGLTGKRFFRTPVPERSRGEIQGAVVRSCAFRTRQGSLAVVGASFPSAEDASVRLTVSGTGVSKGWETRELLDDKARALIGSDWPRTPPASRPVATLIADAELESEGMDIRGRRFVVALAFSQRIVALDAPVELAQGEGGVLRPSKGPIVVAVPACSPDAQLLAAPLDRIDDGEVVVLPPKGPLSLVSVGKRAELGRFGLPDSQLRNPRLVTLQRGKQEPTALAVRDITTNKTYLIGYDRQKGGVYKLGSLDREEAIALPAAPFAAALGHARHAVEDALFWAHGHVFDLAGQEVPALSTETQSWALDGPLAVADVDGGGAPQVMAPTRDGHGVAVLSLQPTLRFRARPAEVREAADVKATVATDLVGEGDTAIVQLTPTRLVAFDGKDGRIRWSSSVGDGATGLVAVAGPGRSHDLVVLSRKTLERFRGADGTSVWKVDSRGAQALVAAGACCCGCGSEDVLLEPAGLVSGRTGKAVYQLEPAKGQGPRALPIAASVGKNERRVFAFVNDEGKSGRALARLSAQGKPEWTLPLPEGAGSLRATAAVDSAGPAGLLLGWGNEVRTLAPGGGPETLATLVKRPGKVLGFALAQPELPLSKLVVLEDAPAPEGGRDSRSAIALCLSGPQTVWARRLPAGTQPPVGPVFLDQGDRAAFVAPSGALVILRMSDGAFLGERRAPEGSLVSLLASYATGETSLLLSLTDSGELVAFDARTAERSEKTDERQTIQELQRKARFGVELARKACDDLDGWQRDAVNKAPAALALAHARLHLADLEGPEQDRADLEAALAAADSACTLAKKLAPALYDRAWARARLAVKAPTPPPEELATAREDILALSAQRTKDAAGLAADVAGLLLERDANEALRFADLAVRASSLDVRARKARVLARLRLLPAADKDLAAPETKWKLELLREDLDVANESNFRSLRSDDPDTIVLGILVLLAQGETPRARELAKRAPAVAASDGASKKEADLRHLAQAVADGKAAERKALLDRLVEQYRATLPLGPLARLIEKKATGG